MYVSMYIYIRTMYIYYILYNIYIYIYISAPLLFLALSTGAARELLS